MRRRAPGHPSSKHTQVHATESTCQQPANKVHHIPNSQSFFISKRYFNYHLLWQFPWWPWGGHVATSSKKKKKSASYRGKRSVPRGTNPPDSRATCPRAILVWLPSPIILCHRGETPESHKEKYSNNISFSLKMEAFSSLHGITREMLLRLNNNSTKTRGTNKRRWKPRAWQAHNLKNLASIHFTSSEGYLWGLIEPTEFSFPAQFSSVAGSE